MCSWNSSNGGRHWPAGLSVAWGLRLRRGRRRSGLLPASEGGGPSQAEPGGVGAGAAGRSAGRGCLRCWPLLSPIPLVIQGGIVCPGVHERVPGERRGRAQSAGWLRQGRLPSPGFRLLSPEQRSEWKPSPNMTSKLLLTTS